jgi:hypothetical protein
MSIYTNFDKSADAIADQFNEVYFEGEGDYYWIGDDRSGLIQINDHFITLADMLFALKNSVSIDGFFKYYNEAIEGTDVEPYEPKYKNLRHYIHTLRSKDLPDQDDASFFAPNF